MTLPFEYACIEFSSKAAIQCPPTWEANKRFDICSISAKLQNIFVRFLKMSGPSSCLFCYNSKAPDTQKASCFLQGPSVTQERLPISLSDAPGAQSAEPANDKNVCLCCSLQGDNNPSLCVAAKGLDLETSDFPGLVRHPSPSRRRASASAELSVSDRDTFNRRLEAIYSLYKSSSNFQHHCPLSHIREGIK